MNFYIYYDAPLNGRRRCCVNVNEITERNVSHFISMRLNEMTFITFIAIY